MLVESPQPLCKKICNRRMSYDLQSHPVKLIPPRPPRPELLLQCCYTQQHLSCIFVHDSGSNTALGKSATSHVSMGSQRMFMHDRENSLFGFDPLRRHHINQAIT